MRSKGALAILFLIIVAGLAGCYGCAGYNGLVASEESVSQAWADVENQYQRRADLVPTLIEVVESAAAIDEALIREVKDSRKAAERARVMNPSDKEALNDFAARQQRLSASLSSLTRLVQSGQGLQSIEAHRDLLVQLEGTENRIAVARRKYNEVVAEHNQVVRRFPRNLVAGMFGFDALPAFAADVK